MNWLLQTAPNLRLAGFESLPVGENWLDARRMIYDHELMCFANDSRHIIEFDDRTIELGRNTFIIIPPGIWHTGRSETARGVYRTWIHFDWIAQPRPADLPTLTYAPSKPVNSFVRHAPDFVPDQIFYGEIINPELFFDQHSRLCRLFETGGLKAQLLARALLLEILTNLLAPDSAPRPAKTDKLQASDIRRSLQLIADKPFCDAPLLKDFLNEQFDKSYEHLCRIFKQKYGTTPLSYIHALRIEKAKQLLLNAPEPVADIAADLGFNDPIYFHRLFKQHTGLTPGKFRKQNRSILKSDKEPL